jgi:arylsulfatase A-like enzyme
MPAKRPNFLFLMTDQHRPDHTGFGGNADVRTPHLDALAATSTRFDRAFVSNPICMPNRASILTGRMPSVHGTRYNGIPLDWSANTFVRALREHGYGTSLVGKAHFQNLGDTPPIPIENFFPNEVDALRDPHPPGWDAFEFGHRHHRERVELPEDFYGFDHVDLTVNHSDLCSGHYYQWLIEQGVDPREIQGRERALQRYEGWNQVWQTATPEELYPTEYITARTIEILERSARSDQPFFLQCSYPDPHHPFTPPGRFWEMYEPRELTLPRTFDDPHTRSMPFYRTRKKFQGSQRFRMQPFAPTEDQLRHCAAAEYGMISFIDEGIGRILDTLEATGLADNTVIVFTSDHGDMFGDHGMMLKAGMHYEGCTRVPFLIRAPGRTPGASRSLVSSIDLAQTLLELAEVPEFHGMQGHSLVPLLDDAGARVRESVLVEEDEIFDLAALGQPLRMRTLVTERARLTLYRGSDHGELFDLERDPDELDNLYGRDEGRVLQGELTEALARELMAVADEAPKPGSMA